MSRATATLSSSTQGLGQILPTSLIGTLKQQIANYPMVALGLVILVPIVFLALVAPSLPLPNYLETNPIESIRPPSLNHPFGTDRLGRDVFSRTFEGARVSLTVGFAVAAIAVGLGIVIGTVSVFSGRVVDAVITAITDVLLSFPGLLLAIALVSVFGAGLGPVIIAIVIADLPRVTRLQRSLALELKSRSFMDAARMVSAPTWWLLVHHVFPNTLAPMLVIASIAAGNAIVVEASLSFLGLGIVLPQPSWGNLIREGQRNLLEAPWISTFPGLVLLAVALALHFIADGVRSGLDPHLRVR
jgi:peptide/nickel transport system permease protein